MNGEFKVPSLPGTSGGASGSHHGVKRKEYENGSAGAESSKKARQSHDPLAQNAWISGPPKSRGSGGPPVPPVHAGAMAPPQAPSRGPTVEDAEDEEMEIQRYQDESSFEADDGDDEDGRFFGGGTNAVQDAILNILAKDDETQVSSTAGPQTVQELRKMMQRFERVVQKNTETRAKYPDDAERIVDSEADLDAILHQFLPLSAQPILFYPEFVKSETFLPLLTGLLTHENPDISIDAIEVIDDWIDEDVGADLEAEDDDAKAAHARMTMGDLITTFVDNSLLELLVSNLRRFDETDETQASGVYKVISIFESLLSFLPPLARQIAETTDLIPWLLERIQADSGAQPDKESTASGKPRNEVDSNRLYASEVLSVLCQEDRHVRLAVGTESGIDNLLRVLSQYRRRDPRDLEEAEFMENVFNCLCGVLGEAECKKIFEDAEGVELMVLMMKERNMARLRAIKVLDYACQTEEGTNNCVKLIEAMGLKSLFSAFMGKGMGKTSKISVLESVPEAETEEHLLGILVSLFSNLASDSAPRIRLLAKFVEGNYEKLDRLIELRDGADNRLAPIEREIAEEREAMTRNGEEISDIEIDEWYLRRLGSGLNQLQNADTVLAWLCMEDDGAMQHARMLLKRRGKTFQNIVRTLRETRDAVADEASDVDENGGRPEPSLQWIILEQLANFVASLA